MTKITDFCYLWDPYRLEGRDHDGDQSAVSAEKREAAFDRFLPGLQTNDSFKENENTKEKTLATQTSMLKKRAATFFGKALQSGKLDETLALLETKEEEDTIWYRDPNQNVGANLKALEMENPLIFLNVMKIRFVGLAKEYQIQQNKNARTLQMLSIQERINEDLEEEKVSLCDLMNKQEEDRYEDWRLQNEDRFDELRQENDQLCEQMEKICEESRKVAAENYQLNNYIRSSSKGECMICLEPYGNERQKCCLQCGHQFCYGCLQTLMRRSNFNCPICRKQFRSRNIIKMF